MLLGTLPEEALRPHLPPAWMAELAALRWRKDLLSHRLVDLGLVDEPDMVIAATALALPGLLLHEQAGADEVLAALTTHTTSGLRNWVEHALGFWSEHFTSLSNEQVAQLAGQHIARATAEARRKDLIGTWHASSQANFGFIPLDRAWNDLFGSGGPLRQIRLIADVNDTVAARQWLVSLGSRRNRLVELMDDATARVVTNVGHRDKDAVGHRRDRALDRLAKIIAALEAWVEVADAVPEEADAWLIGPAIELSEALRSSLGDVESQTRDAVARRSLAAPLLVDMLRELRPLLALSETWR